MTVALRSPKLLGALIPVDNAPVDANLNSDFHMYVQGMQEIEGKRVKKQAEADEILTKYEEVGRVVLRSKLAVISNRSRHNRYANSSSRTSSGMESTSAFVFLPKYLLQA